MIVAFSKWVIRWRWWLMLLCIAATVAAGSGVRFLEFTTDYRVFFSKENPQLQAFEELQDVYSKNDNVLFVIAPKDGTVFTRETLATVEWLTEAAWQLPHSNRVDSITNFQYTYADADDLVVSNLIENADTFSNEQLVRAKEIALAEPLLINRLISPQTHVTGVNATIILPGKGLHEVPEVVAKARELVDQAKAKNPNIDIYLTGVVLMNNAFPEAAQNDLAFLVPLMYLVVIIVLALTLRSVSGTILTVVVTMMSVVTAMGLTGWLGIKMTPPSSAAPTIILTLAIADSVHILVTLLTEVRDGKGKYEAIVEALRINVQPVFLTSLTTVIGFLSMNFSDAPPFRDLGNIVAMGISAAFVYSVLFLPAAMAVMPLRVRRRPIGAAGMDRFAEFVIRNRRRLLWGMTLAILVLVAFIPRNQLNDQFVEYFAESIPFRTDTDFSVANLTGIYRLQYSLNAGSSGAISDPTYLKTLEEFANWYRRQPEVIHVNTLTDTMKRLNKNMHSDDAKWYRIPEERNLAAQYLLLYELSLPFGLDLNDQINVDKSATRLTATLKNLTTKGVLSLEARAQQWLRDNAPAHMFAHGAGPSIMFSYIGYRNIRSMLFGGLVALILISGLILLATRSVKIGLVSLFPNLLPAGMAFGLWGLLVGQVGLALSVVATMSLGIVVDDTIHYLSKYLRARREQNLNAPDAVRYAFHTVGTALWVNTLILVAGFFVLAFSAFELNAGMGLLTAITIALALLADFLFLPPLLMKLEERKYETTAAAVADTRAA
ncbi:MAG: MMPL family transporter [Gammaproteobacteria bacterium]|nr:MMPL family transporter [Gammaproteobacteria bacterium]